MHADLVAKNLESPGALDITGWIYLAVDICSVKHEIHLHGAYIYEYCMPRPTNTSFIRHD